MEAPIRILHLEDVESDAALVKRELKKSDLSFEYLWAKDEADYRKELIEFSPDIILSDHSLISYTSLDALRALKETNLKIPFILITGAMSEEFVVKMMKEGIDDYLLKDRLVRLPKAIHNAIEKSKTEREKEKYFNEIISKERKYRALIENISDAIILVNREGYILYNSPSVKRIIGFDTEELQLKTIFDFFHADDLKEGAKDFQTAIENPCAPIYNSFRVLHKDGSYTWTESVIINLLHDESVKAFIVIYRDITQRKASQQLLQKSEANLKTIFNTTTVTYVFTDRNFKILSFNKRAAVGYKKEFGANLEEGRNLLEYMPIERKELVKKRSELALLGDKINYEVSFMQEDSSLAWYNVNIFPVADEMNNALGLVIASEDITERKTSELEKSKMAEDIFHRNQDLEQFANIISHNLRSPVANIIGISNLILESDNMNAEVHKKLVNGLMLSTKKLDGVIVDLNLILDVRQKKNENKQRIQFMDIVNDVTESIKDIIIKEDIVVETEFGAVTGMFTVKSYCHSIFYNLISNSIKYRRQSEKTFIKISSKKVEDGILLSFQDNGIGIDLNAHGTKLFGLYKRFHNHIEGKGMGLYMVKTQVEMLGGKIEVKSNINEGTVFLIKF